MKPNTLSRRRLLGSAASAAVLGRLPWLNALAQTPAQPASTTDDYKALVCIYLAGGNDGHNTIVPISLPDYPTAFSDYKTARGSIALPDANGALLPVNTTDGRTFGLNPGLSHIHSLWSPTSGSGKLAALANVGMLVKPFQNKNEYLQKTKPAPTNLFSHSDQMQQMQSGVPSTSGGTGWGGRAADVMQPMNGLSSFPTAVSLVGPQLYCMGDVIQSTSLYPGFDLDMSGMNIWPQTAAAARLQGLRDVLQFNNGMELVANANLARQDAMDLNALLIGNTANVTSDFPGSQIGAQLKQVAKIIKLRSTTGMSRQVFMCMLGGFDTHYSQSWQHWNLLDELSEAMAAFYKATEVELGIPDKVTTFTLSEFGRTLQPSGLGCDHGWGSNHLIMGGAVKGGQVYGTFPTLVASGPDDSGNRGAMIPTTSIAQYGATLAKWFGVPDENLAQVFPSLENFDVKDLGFMA